MPMYYDRIESGCIVADKHNQQGLGNLYQQPHFHSSCFSGRLPCLGTEQAAITKCHDTASLLCSPASSSLAATFMHF